jgi:ATP-dependent DNA helicase RecG
MKELYTETELRRLLEQEEGQFLEFKSLWHLDGDAAKPLDRRTVRDWIAEYVAAFANADGGTILLGVDDDGTPSGHAYPEEAVQEFLAVPERRLRPSVKVHTQQITIDVKQVIVIQVHMHPEAIMVDGNGFPYRVDDEVIRAPQEVINARKQAYRRVGYEQRVRPEASMEDIDLELARSFLSKTVQADRPVEELLEKYGLIIAKAGGPAITNAALLLFGKQPLARWHPRSGIRFFRVEGTKREHGARRNVQQLPRLELPTAALIQEAYRTASLYIRRGLKDVSLNCKRIWQPMNALATRSTASCFQ